MSKQSKEDTARKLLGFTDAVAEYIAPVLMPYGFVFVSSSVYAFEFTSNAVRLIVTHDPLSYEIEIYLNLKEREANKISLGDLVCCESGPMPSPGVFFQSSNRSGVASSIREMSALLARYGRSVLIGEPTAFKLVESSQTRLAALDTENVVENPIREEAEESWRRRDFERVCDLYESIESKLTPSEKKRLSYARKHV
jgi:hypothetical protein